MNAATHVMQRKPTSNHQVKNMLCTTTEVNTNAMASDWRQQQNMTKTCTHDRRSTRTDREELNNAPYQNEVVSPAIPVAVTPIPYSFPPRQNVIPTQYNHAYHAMQTVTPMLWDALRAYQMQSSMMATHMQSPMGSPHHQHSNIAPVLPPAKYGNKLPSIREVFPEINFSYKSM